VNVPTSSSALWVLHRLLLLLLVLSASAAVPRTLATGSRSEARALPTTMWTQYWDVRVRATPGGRILTQLDLDQEVRVLGSSTSSDGVRWARIKLWGALNGWIDTGLLASSPVSHPPTSGVAIAPSPVGPHAPMPLHAKGIAAARAALRNSPNAVAQVLQTVAKGALLTIARWATDSRGRAWYGTTSPISAWIDADQVVMLPTKHLADVRLVHGVGMWLTPPVLAVASPESIVAAARTSHITHLYVEVGASSGFYGQGSLDRLLPVAHRAHIAVLAWVYPFLDDVPHDVAVSLAVARYVSPTGDRPDGLAADVEQNMGEPYVRAYGQVLRARLGPHVLMLIATYPPQSGLGQQHPFATTAQSWDVIVPMDYWNVSLHPYTAVQAYAYVATSIKGIRKATGNPAVPIEVLGQMFDVFGDGRHSPTKAEVLGAMRAARDGHATGISFFEWNHATPDEWDALQS
jgi:hypothetical protein